MFEPSSEEKRIAADILIAAIQAKLLIPSSTSDPSYLCGQIDQAYQAILQTVLRVKPAETP